MGTYIRIIIVQGRGLHINKEQMVVSIYKCTIIINQLYMEIGNFSG